MSKLHKAQTQQGHSKVFFEYIRCIGEAKAKQEEDRIIAKDLIDLKKTMSEKGLENKAHKEAVVRMFYAEMLGQNAEFGHIHAVNLVPSPYLHYKRTGYLATWLCVNPEHEFMYLLVSNLQRDMKSNSFLEVSAALTAAAKLLKPELMTCINTDVTQLLSHPNALVRKKAVLAMHAFYRKSEGVIADMPSFRKALCDRDPSVMGASLCLFLDVCLLDPESQRDLLPSFISILKQITEHRLAREFDYHRVPAPWLQIKLLQLMAILAGDDKQLSEKCTEVLMEVMKRADTGLNIGHAVIFEAITTITAIHPIPALIEAAAEAIARFLTSSNANMKYLGITALSRIVKIDRRYAQQHQHIVMGCLEDSDDTIRRKTLTLLFAMCNENNVEPIVDRLIKFLADSNDRFLRRELVTNIVSLAEDLRPDNQWFVESMNRVIELAAEHVPQAAIQGMLKVIAEGDGEDEAEDAELRTDCVEGYFKLMEDPDKVFPPALYQVAAWVIGEYGFLTKKISRVMMIDRLCDMIERVHDADTRGWIIQALMKLVSHTPKLPDNVDDVLTKIKNCRSVGLQQRCYEFIELSKMMPIMKKVQPVDGCCEDIEVDETLSFLDGIVEEALSAGARPFQSREVRLGAKEDGAGLKTEAYKTARTDIVDEDELNAARFNEEEEKLIIRDGAKRWGAKNLEEEAAIEKPIETIREDSEERNGGAAGSGAAAAGGHVDPHAVPDGPRKPTKNEKFINDLFGGSPADGATKRKRKGRAGDRAKEAARRAEEAEEATRGMTVETASINGPGSGGPSSSTAAPSAPLPQAAGGSSRSSSTAASGNAAKAQIQTNIQKQLGPDCLRVRFGIMADQNVTNVRLAFTPPPQCDFASVACAAPAATVNGAVVVVPAVPAKAPVFVELTVHAKNYLTGGGLTGEITFSSAGGEGVAKGALPLAFPDLLRPTAMTTAEFGQMWPKLTAGECRCQMKFPVALKPEILQKHIGERAQVKIIEVIKAECIAATRIVPRGPPILVHMAISGQTVNTTVRCGSKPFAEAMCKVLTQGL